MAHDFGFAGKDNEPVMPMLVSKGTRTGWTAAEVVPTKSAESEYTVGVIARAIKHIGFSRFVHKSDQERTLKSAMDKAMQKLGPRYEALDEDSAVGTTAMSLDGISLWAGGWPRWPFSASNPTCARALSLNKEYTVSR